MVGTVAMFFALRLDRLVLAIAVGSHSLGLFTVALAVPEALRVLPKAFGQVIADRGRSGIDSVDTARRHCRLAVAGHCAVLAVAASLGWLLLPAVFGEGFSGARDVLVVVTLAEAMLSVHLMDQALLVGFGRPYGIGIPQVVGAVVTIALDLIMIPKWGMQGAAWACLFGYSALALTSTIWTNHELRRSGSG
jgi:O-antigen/teichoic acid export membrane protein|tara:strand:- start:144 stop:719 length:576 start_codon:yes stop_codon:yes gene_type:complete